MFSTTLGQHPDHLIAEHRRRTADLERRAGWLGCLSLRRAIARRRTRQSSELNASAPEQTAMSLC